MKKGTWSHFLRIVILGNGDWESLPRLSSIIKKDDFVIACDGAYDQAKRHGVKPNLIIGDFDSIQSKALDPKIKLLKFPKDKDETDGELAFQYAFKKKPKEILWIAPFGGRWDYSLANISLLAQAARKRIPVKMIQGEWEIYLVLSSITIEGRKGDRLSLHPLSKEVGGIKTAGLKYPLSDETLRTESTRGLSNELIARTASVTIKSGRLLVFHHTREGVRSR